MIKKLLKLLLSILVFGVLSLRPLPIHAQDTKLVEIVDLRQNKVIKEIKLNPDIQNMVAGWVANIDSVYAKLNLNTDTGYVVKIPLDPAVAVQNKLLNAVVSDVYILIPENGQPFYIIFEDDDKLTCYQFNGDVKALSKVLGFDLSPKP